MEKSFKPIPLVLTPAKLFKEVNSDSGMVKKRKLSMSSDSSDSTTSGERNMLAEQFSDLTLNIRSPVVKSENNSMKIEEPSDLARPIVIPKPVKLGKVVDEGESPNIQPKKDFLLENVMNFAGISKYLNLDLGEKLNTLNKLTHVPSPENDQHKFKTSSLITSFLKTPFASPFLNLDLLSTTTTPLSNSNSSLSRSNFSDSDAFGGKYSSYKSPHYIGPLTREERKEKVERFLEKKKHRKWKHIRYAIRKDLAEQRERVQGRFVKTNKSLSHSDIISREKEKLKLSMDISDNKSAVQTDSPALNGSWLGKRSDKADLNESAGADNSSSDSGNFSS